MKKNNIIIIIGFISNLLFGQVGINTENPQGVLHIKNKTQKMGLVMPIVSSAPVTVTPSGTTPVEATVVYDSLKQCLRLNTSVGWSDCLLDKSAVQSIVNIAVNGDSFWMTGPYSSLTDQILQKKYSYGYTASIFSSATDNLYLNGAGYSTTGLGIAPAQTVSPAKRVSAYVPLTMAGSNDAHMFITAIGEVYVTGSNEYGRLGIGSTTSPVLAWTKISIPGLTSNEKPIQILANSISTIILTDKGNVFAAGANIYGHTGQGTNSGQLNTFTKIPGLSNIKSIWGEFDRSFYNMYTAIDNNGNVFAWGLHYYTGVLGNTVSYVSTPQNINSFFSAATSGGAKVKKVMISYASALALMDDGTLWGSVGQGQNLYRIGLGNVASATNALVNLMSALNLDSGEKIVDFDMDDSGDVVITDHYVRFTGPSTGYRFGNGNAGVTYNWTKLVNSFYDGIITLQGVDLGYAGMMIGTASGTTAGGNRIIVSGYNPYGTIGTTNYGGYAQNSQWAKF